MVESLEERRLASADDPDDSVPFRGGYQNGAWTHALYETDEVAEHALPPMEPRWYVRF